MPKRPVYRQPLSIALGACAAAALVPGIASASQSQMWFTDYTPGLVASANLDGSNANSFAAQAASGTAFDVVSQRVIWFKESDKTLRSADLSGANPSTPVSISSVVTDPYGITFDQSTGRVYYGQYAQASANTVFWATLDGQNATQVAYQGPLAKRPTLVTVDPSSERVYWLNALSASGYTIGWASTRAGSSDAGEITRSGGGACSASGVRTDAYLVLPQRGEIVWNINASGTKSFERTDMDGSNCRVLTAPPSGSGLTYALSFDPATNRVIYGWSGDGQIHYFDIDNPTISGIITLSGPYASVRNNPQYPVIVAAPTGTATVAPVAGAADTLRCTASFYPGIPSAGFYSSATSATSYSWTRDGAAVAGETSDTLTATQAGAYRCIARASNFIGEGSSTSEPYVVNGGSPSPSPSPSSSSSGQAAGGGGTSTSSGTRVKVRIAPRRAATGLSASAAGTVQLPLSCPSGLSSDCDASGELWVTLPGSVAAERGRAEQARKRLRTLARFRGVEIASGTTRVYTVRLAPTTFNALRRAGIRRIPADVRIVNQLAGGAPVISTQRVWLRIPPLAVPVAG